MTCRVLLGALFGISLSAVAFPGICASPVLTPHAQTTVPTHGDGAKAFDFIIGHWNVRNRRLVKRLAGSHQWIAFDSTDDCHALPGGIGNEEHYFTDHWKNFVAVGLRLYNPVSKQWSLYWVDNHNAPGVLQTPVSGSFKNGIGIFEGRDEINGKPIKVRFTWEVLGNNSAHWEQAFSADDGKTWETNWIMDFTRQTSTAHDRQTP